MTDVSDYELAALSGRRVGTGKWAKVLLGVMVIGTVGFVGGFYLPLREAQHRLSAEFESLGQKHKLLNIELVTTKAQLEKTQAEEKRLADAVRSEEEKVQGEAGKLTAINARLETNLAQRLKQKLVSISKLEDRVSVRVAATDLFAPNSVVLSPRGLQMLCEVGKAALGAEGVRLTVVGHADGTQAVPGFLATTYKSWWDVTAAQASTLSAALIDRCKLSGEHVQASALAGLKPLAGAEPAKNARVEFEVSVR